ncbi:MAG: extracellular solute-binding protein [Spirochaetaceae bacterium]|jgi:multiple sugar transport system substrate-binding protein|nr:extracellular solute-binding protein [Spirochaetaceae bacterium]
MKKGMFVLVALAVSSAMVFAGGVSQPKAGTAAGPGTIRWSFWGGEARIKNTQLAIDKFTESTGIIVAAEPAPGTGDHFNKFKTQFAGGNAADLIQLGGDFSNLQVGDDVGSVLLPLDSFVKSGIIDLSKVDASAITAGTVNGALYALPLAANMPSLLYNKALLERVGAPLPKVSMNWDEFRSWLTAVKGKLPAGVYPMADNSANSDQSFFFAYWCGQNKTVMWDGKQTRLTAGDAQKYFDLWADYRSAGLIPPAETAADYSETNESSSSLIAGKVAVCVIWSNQLLNYQNATEDELDLIEIPNAAVTKALWGQMSQMMSISKNSKNAEAAAKFINYRVNDTGVWKIMGADPGTPVNSEGRAIVATTPAAKKIADYLDVAGGHTRPRDPNMPGDTEWNSSFFLIAQNVAYGKISSAQAGQQVMDLIARLTR